MTEQEARERLEVLFDDSTGENYPFTECFAKAVRIAASVLEEIQKYRALGTVEELQKAKTQYENIASCAEKISMSGLCDYEEAQKNIVSYLKATSKNTLEEYIKIGTVEELRETREKQRARKPNIDARGFIKCPYCQSVLKKTDKFCHDCGIAIDWRDE